MEGQLREQMRKEADFNSMSADYKQLKLRIEANDNLIKKYTQEIEGYKRQLVDREWELLGELQTFQCII